MRTSLKSLLPPKPMLLAAPAAKVAMLAVSLLVITPLLCVIGPDAFRVRLPTLPLKLMLPFSVMPPVLLTTTLPFAF